jgi:hypothetical protein
LFAAAACRTLPLPDPPAALALRPTPGAVITVVNIATPWYATRGIITGKFRELVPEYRAIPALERKQFSFAASGAYGGIYVWRESAAAAAWFGPAWHERVRKQRGHDGDVRFIPIARALDGPVQAQAFEGPMVVAIALGSLDSYASAPGLRSAYEGDGLVVSMWQSKAAADAVVRDAEWFDTPVGIVNDAR